MRKHIVLASLLALGAMLGCNEDSLDAVITVDSNFQTLTDGWKAEFSGYSSLTDTASMDTVVLRSRLPTGLDTSQYAYKVTTRNIKDNMFSYLKKKVTGFTPNGTYNLVFDIDFATPYPEDTSKGAPWNLIYLKAGASPTEPVSKLINKIYQFNLDKGALTAAGKDVAVAGTVDNRVNQRRYALVRYSNADRPFQITANQQGEIWLFVGTDSNYKAATTFYYDRIIATVKEQ